MVTVRRAISVLKAIKALEMIGKDTSISQIARVISEPSRATVFRMMPELTKLGLVEVRGKRNKHGNVYFVYQVPERGEEFLASCKGLPL